MSVRGLQAAVLRTWIVLLLVILPPSFAASRAADKRKSAKAESEATEKRKATQAKSETKESAKPKSPSRVFSAADDTSAERILLTLSAHPATEQAVSWRMRPTSNSVQAQIARGSAGLIRENATTTVLATVERVGYGGGQTMFHASALFKNLQPQTLYAYRVGDGKTWSEWNHFRTAGDRPEPFRFLYIGDLQNEIKAQGARVLREAILKAPDARFIAHAGDLVSEPSDDRQWYEWYEAAGWVYRMIPSLPVPGNHDVGSGRGNTIWRAQFILPRNGPQGLEELSYYVDYQGVRLIALNSVAYTSQTQMSWLESILSDNPCRWTIVVTHHPLYSIARDRDSTGRRDLLMPVYDKYGVDLALQGHDHGYGRTPRIRAGQTVKPDEPGVIYIVSVSGGKMYKLNRASRPFMSRMAANVQLYQVLSVAGDSLRYEAYAADGSLFDSFELKKTGRRDSVLIDRAPSDEHPREEDFHVEEKRDKAGR